MKKIDKLKKQRYEVSMKIISLEAKSKIKKLSKKEEKEYEIIQELEKNLDKKKITKPADLEKVVVKTTTEEIKEIQNLKKE